MHRRRCVILKARIKNKLVMETVLCYLVSRVREKKGKEGCTEKYWWSYDFYFEIHLNYTLYLARDRVGDQITHHSER